MDISFDTKELQRQANDEGRSHRKMGAHRSTIFHKRLSALRAAETLEDMRNMPGHYHELKGERKGQWACDLDQPYRLIFKPRERPVPTNPNGSYNWSAIKSICIVEVVDYHD